MADAKPLMRMPIEAGFAMPEIQTKPNYFVQLVAFFLAEIIRSRRTSIRRAAEISELMVRNLPSLTSEAAALGWIEKLERDFEELTDLRQALSFKYDTSNIKVYDGEIRQYASILFERDMAQSAAFLKDAAQPGMVIQELCIKYPDFCDYLIRQTDKAALLPELHPAM